MRRLLLFRHAKATQSKPDAEDRPRILIKRGRKDSTRIGTYLATDALIPDRVLVSPAARTQETWEFAALALRSAVEVVTVEQLYDATPDTIIGLIKETPAEVHSLMVIGHNPGLHDLALTLIASGNVDARKRLKERLPTGGMAIIDFAFDDWGRIGHQSGRLERFVTPKSLDANAR